MTRQYETYSTHHACPWPHGTTKRVGQPSYPGHVMPPGRQELGGLIATLTTRAPRKSHPTKEHGTVGDTLKRRANTTRRRAHLLRPERGGE